MNLILVRGIRLKFGEAQCNREVIFEVNRWSPGRRTSDAFSLSRSESHTTNQVFESWIRAKTFKRRFYFNPDDLAVAILVCPL